MMEYLILPVFLQSAAKASSSWVCSTVCAGIYCPTPAQSSGEVVCDPGLTGGENVEW